MFLSQREALFFFLSFFVFSPEANVTLTANFFLPEKYSTVKSSLFSRSATQIILLLISRCHETQAMQAQAAVIPPEKCCNHLPVAQNQPH